MTKPTPYPRDLRGYGANPPDARWPGGARVAVSFVLNYEEGGENCILHGDAGSEAFLSEIVSAVTWPGQRHMNMESIYEYGARAGFWRLYRLFTGARVPLTVYGVATALERSPEQVVAMKQAGWEIASHGYKWIEYKDFTREAEADHLARAIATHTASVGARPTGWYLGRASVHTLPLVASEGGFLWYADAYADDLPYWVESEGHVQLVVPYTLDANDMRFATPQGFNTGDDFYRYLKDSFDCLYREGGEGRPAMMSVGMHCRLLGRPGRAESIRRFIEYVQSHDHVWIATREQIATHWARHHRGGLAPHRLNRPTFVAAFGDVWEHSPWVAEATWDAGLAEGLDAEGLAAAMSRAMRAGSPEQKRALVLAHPDLAGKLAAARLLTPDSTAEQASAGLDRLTPDEKARFTALNDAYRARFGFPFIIAVKGLNKAQILSAFEARLNNDAAQEFETALAQIERIALLRLKDRL